MLPPPPPLLPQTVLLPVPHPAFSFPPGLVLAASLYQTSPMLQWFHGDADAARGPLAQCFSMMYPVEGPCHMTDSAFQ